MQRGNRFLKQFRQRMAQHIRESSYEHQHRPRRSIRV
jgi:hypothetical protein